MPSLQGLSEIIRSTTLRKQRIEYDTPLDALIAVTKRLSGHEAQHGITSEEFFDRYCKGRLGDEAFLVD